VERDDEQQRDQVDELQQESLPAEEQLDEQEPIADKATRFDLIVALSHAALHGAEIADVLAQAPDLSPDERAALATLSEIARGRHLDARLIYAEERLGQLNHVLAVLQPVLAVGLSPELTSLRDGYNALVDDVSTLRDSLEKLVDAQEEMFEQDREPPKVTDDEEPNTDDGADPDEDAEPEPEPEPPSTLGTPEDPDEPEPPPAKSTVWDPDAG
jgi:hypothetical protein